MSALLLGGVCESRGAVEGMILFLFETFVILIFVSVFKICFFLKNVFSFEFNCVCVVLTIYF